MEMPPDSDQESAMQDRWLSVDEGAAYLGVKRDTIYKWIDRKQMPAKKVGRLWKFKKDQIDESVNAGHSAADSQSARDWTAYTMVHMTQPGPEDL